MYLNRISNQIAYLLLREMEEVTLYQPKREGEEAGNGRSFLLVDENENLQDSCTVGVWAAFEPALGLVALDTEGLLGASGNQNQRMRLLLKVLAVSDVVVYRTRAERLHNDMFQFLGSASSAYVRHFTRELRALSSRCGLEVPLSSLGPAVIVFQETSRTRLLGWESSTPGQADILLQKRFHELGLSTEAFSSVQYVGTQTVSPPTDYSGLLSALKQQVRNTATRSPRPPAIVYSALQALSERFCGEISDEKINLYCFFPDEYFTCSSVCLSCGYVLECPCCGIIYRSRQYWIGNQDPESCVVRPEVKHVWPGSETFLTDHQNAAQRMLDGMNFVIQSVSDYSSGPTKAVTAWITDQVAPPYWRPNADITACSGCKKLFEELERKHHCRACGEGFCQACSSKTMPVPERGWGSASVRVCDSCYRQGGGGSDVPRTEPVGLMARRVTEVAQSTVDFVSTAMDYPLCFVKGVARPDYWMPDHEIQQCGHCSKAFSPRMSKHHCRACGGGFCAQCSSERRPVPSRGWDHPVRVCIHCSQNKGEL
ncbi:UNVERIFIED_CONTAM: hypothetical protein FKN15_003921 [Acipenser sinensis]